MYFFYNGENLKQILFLLISKSRKEKMSVLVLFKEAEKMKDFSNHVWNQVNCVPHGIEHEAYEAEQNVIFRTSFDSPKDILIVVEDADFDSDWESNFKKILFVGLNHAKLGGRFLEHSNGKWTEKA
jgi:DNA polymerase IIIc chi subunit